MTGVEFSRRDFLRGGAVIVGFSLTATLVDLGKASAAKLGSGGDVQNGWIVVQALQGGGTGTSITVYCPKVEIGTGTQTALGQIVVEELSADMSQLTWVQGDTDFDPPVSLDHNSEGYTAGSQTVQGEGPFLRSAAAAAFQALEQLAMSYFGISSPSGLSAADGVFSYHNKKVTYGALIGSQVIDAAPTSSTAVKSYKDYSIVGTSVERVDLPAKFFGDFQYSADVRLPGMLFARVVRPSGRNATFDGWSTTPLYTGGPSYYQAVLSMPGIEKIVNVPNTNFVYILSSEEYAAQYAVMGKIYYGYEIAAWRQGAAMVPEESLVADPSTNPLMNTISDGGLVYASDNPSVVGDATSALTGAQQQATAAYYTPFQMHGAMAGSAAVANWDGSTMTVYSGTQGPGPLQAAITEILKTYDPNFSGNVHIIYTEQSGCYGHDGADDVSAEAALISYIEKVPVKLQWTRADEHQWEPLGPAMAHAMQGGVTDGDVVSWQHDVYSPTHNSRPNAGAAAGNLLVAQCLGMPPAPMPGLAPYLLATRNGPVNYAFPASRTGRHFATSFELKPGTQDAAEPLTWKLPRSTALRSLGGFSNSFANESFMDELAQLAGAADPIAWRKSYLSSDERALAVLDAVAKMPGTLASPASGYKTGRGVGFIRYENVYTYVAVICDVKVEMSSGQVSVTDVYVAHDCGLVVNPNGLENQIQGNVIQGTSRTLIERVDYSGDAVTQQSWIDNPGYNAHGYPVIQFNQVPNITIQLLDHPSQKAWGAGEAGILAMPGAIGNAVFNATGARIRTLPMTPATVLAAL